MLKRFLFIIILFLLAVRLFSPLVVRILALNYLRTEFKIEATIASLEMIPAGLIVKGFAGLSQDIALELERGEFLFSLDPGLRLAIRRVDLDGFRVKLKNLRKITDLLDRKFTSSRLGLEPKSSTLKPIVLNLKDIRIESDLNKTADLDINFSLKVQVRGSGIELIENLDISDLNFTSSNFTVRGLSLKSREPNSYILRAPFLKLRKKQMGKIEVPLDIFGNKISFEGVQAPFLGTNADLKGFLDLENWLSVPLELSLDNVSFSSLISALSETQDFSVSGSFGGKGRLLFTKGRLSDIEVSLISSQGGAININKEASLDFLKNYLDRDSYKALVDSLKNYEYNSGRVNLAVEGSSLKVALNFDSQTSGQRNIVVNLHNLLGFEQN